MGDYFRICLNWLLQEEKVRVSPDTSCLLAAGRMVGEEDQGVGGSRATGEPGDPDVEEEERDQLLPVSDIP